VTAGSFIEGIWQEDAMVVSRLLTVACVTASLAALTLPAQAQPMGPRGPGGGAGAGMGRQGVMMNDPAGYLDGLKAQLKISPAQEGAWATYATAVKDHAAQMQAAHKTMFEAMGTATWQERRDMMNNMFATRQQAMTAVHDAANKLMEALTAEQRRQAAGILPGMGGPGMGRGPRN
jgi:protein CpxP